MKQTHREREQGSRLKLESIHSPEKDMDDLHLADIIDVQGIQSLMDHFYQFSHLPMSILDLQGNILVGVGWQEICLNFHRVHPTTNKNCIESVTELSTDIATGTFKRYKCKNNLWHISTPIDVEGRKTGNLFLGQFFYDDEPLDYDLFRSQAQKYNFHEKKYLAALKAVPRLSRQSVDTGIAFFQQLSRMISELSYTNLKLAKSLAERDALMDSLRKSELRLRLAQNAANAGTWECDLETGKNFWTDELARLYGLDPHGCEPSFEAWLQTIHPEDRGKVEQTVRDGVGKETELNVEWRVPNADGGDRWLMSRGRPIRDPDGTIRRYIGIVIDITERKLAEQALRESKEDLNRAQTVAHTGSWRLDIRGDQLMWSDETYRMFGIPKETLLTYSTFLALVHPDDREYVDRKWKEALHGKPYNIKHRVVTGRNVKWVREKAELEFDKKGVLKSALGTVQDITDRVKAAELVRSSALFPEENPSPVFRVAGDGILLYSNRASTELMNLWQCRIGVPVPQAIQQEVAVALTEEKQREVSVSCMGRDLLLHLVPVMNRNYVNFYSRDVTERKMAEEALRKRETQFKLLSETAGLLLKTEKPQEIINDLSRKVMAHLDCQAFLNFLVDEEGKHLRLNAWAGIPEEETGKIEGLEYDTTVCGCGTRECRHVVAEDTFRTSDPCTDLFKSYAIQAYACHPMIVEDRLIGRLSFATNTRASFSQEDLAVMKTVTEQVAIAVERQSLMGQLRKSRDELEKRVQERTAELKKMNEDQKLYMTMLEQSNRNLEDFAHVASHDLQEPLRKIQTFSGLLLETHKESLDEESCDFLMRMKRAAGRMQTLVTDLLQYARVNTKTEPFTRFNLRVPVEEAIADLHVLREETEGCIEVGELPEVEADHVQMRQLFQNLIGNGLKYHGERRPLVKVHCNPLSSGRLWEIHVKDNGIGFDELHLQSIFKPFQRLHGRSSPYEGTGMGLAICRKIVERHGGSITARSKTGEESTFIVKLPKKQLKIKETP